MSSTGVGVGLPSQAGQLLSPRGGGDHPPPATEHQRDDSFLILCLRPHLLLWSPSSWSPAPHLWGPFLPEMMALPLLPGRWLEVHLVLDPLNFRLHFFTPGFISWQCLKKTVPDIMNYCHTRKIRKKHLLVENQLPHLAKLIWRRSLADWGPGCRNRSGCSRRWGYSCFPTVVWLSMAALVTWSPTSRRNQGE